MNTMQRKPNETQKQYKERLREEKQAARNRPVRMLWNSSLRGTYVRAKHGELVA